MAKDTKYYFIDFAIRSDLKEINPEEIKGFVKDGKATENWIFMQIDATIQYIFEKHNIPCPHYVFVNRDYKYIGEMTLTIVRDNFKNEKEAMFWNVQKMYIQDELNSQARSNSDEEDGMVYKFEII